MYSIGIAGPTCSGKTSVCINITRRLGDAEYLSSDDFLVEKREYPTFKGFLNMDSPVSIKFDDLFLAMENLKNSIKVEVPIYDKELSKVVGKRTANPRSFLLTEGFLLFHDERIRKLMDLKFFLDLPFNVQENRRLKRKIHYDKSYFNDVVMPMYETYVKPTAKYADFIINADRPIECVSKEMEEIIRECSKQVLKC